MSLELYSQAFAMRNIFNEYMRTTFGEQSYYPMYIVGLMLFTYMLVNARCASDSDIDESISILVEKQANLEQRLAEAQAKFIQTEKLVAAAQSLATVQAAVTEAQTEDIAFACQVASAVSVGGTGLPEAHNLAAPIQQYLRENPGKTAREILDFLSTCAEVNQKLKTKHIVNSCLYNMVNQGTVTKTATTPPIWSLA